MIKDGEFDNKFCQFLNMGGAWRHEHRWPWMAL